jgi:PKD repeat protein
MTVARTDPDRAGRPHATTRSARLVRGRPAALAGLAVVLVVILSLGVAGAQPAGPAATPRPGHAPAPLAFPSPIRHVFVVYFENEEISSVQQNAPFMEYLAHRYASASNYYALCHPSAPNYLASTSGATWQCGSDNVNTYSTENIFDLAQRAGLSWNDFSESMPQACYTQDTFPSGTYVAHHNPAIFYSDIVGNSSLCAAHDLSFSSWNSDVTSGTIPNYAFFAPNMNDDGHQTGTAYADNWLKGWLSPYLNDSWFSTTAWFIVFDEGTSNAGYNGSYGGHVFLTAVSPYSEGGLVVSRNANHYDLLATEEWLLGLPVGGCGHNDNSSATSPLKGLFNFTSSTGGSLRVNVTANALNGTPPLSVAFGAQISGGTAPYRYAWTFGDGGSSTLPAPDHTFVTSGTYNVSVNVTDATGASATGGLTVRVSPNATGPPPLHVTIAAAPVSGVAPLTVQFTADATGGTPPYAVAWSSGAGGAAQGASVSFVYPAAGNFTATATVTDSLGLVATAERNVTVYAPLSADVDIVRNNVTIGETITANVTVTGGPPGAVYTYAWTVNGTPVPGNGSMMNYTATRPGPLVVRVTVTDTLGDRVGGTANVSVVAPPNHPPPARNATGLPPWLAPVAAGVAVAIGLGAGLALWWRRRARPPPAPT